MRPCIGLVVPSLEQGGGVPSVARFVLDTLQRDGRYRIKLISLATSSTDSCSTRLSSPRSWFRGVMVRGGQWQGLPIHHVGANLTDFEFQRYRARRALLQVVAECDVLQMVSGSPAWANAIVGMGKPVALQVATLARVERRRRDANPRSLADFWRKSMTIITNRFDDRALHLVDAIQVENPWMLEYAGALNAMRDVDLRYAPPGVDAEIFHPLVQRELKSDPYILCVARLSDPRKNIGLLLEAYAKLPRTLVDRVRLVLAGSSEPPISFWQRAEQLGLRERISYVARPTYEDLIRLYQMASVFALSSDEEGLGIVLLEAMACAVPVVATRCGGPDGIITDGHDGYLVKIDDAKLMSDRLRILLEDQDKNISMGIKARHTIDSKYSNKVAGAAFLDTWEKLLKTRETY